MLLQTWKDLIFLRKQSTFLRNSVADWRQSHFILAITDVQHLLFLLQYTVVFLCSLINYESLDNDLFRRTTATNGCHWLWVETEHTGERQLESHTKQKFDVKCLYLSCTGGGSRNHLEKKLLVSFYCSACCIMLWFETVADKRALQRVTKITEKISSRPLPPLEDIANSCCLRRAVKIVADPSHPGHHLLYLLPSGKWFRSLRCRTKM